MPRERARAGRFYNVDALTPWKILGEHNAPVLDPIAGYGGNSGVSYEGGFNSSGWKENCRTIIGVRARTS